MVNKKILGFGKGTILTDTPIFIALPQICIFFELNFRAQNMQHLQLVFAWFFIFLASLLPLQVLCLNIWEKQRNGSCLSWIVGEEWILLVEFDWVQCLSWILYWSNKYSLVISKERMINYDMTNIYLQLLCISTATMFS